MLDIVLDEHVFASICPCLVALAGLPGKDRRTAGCSKHQSVLPWQGTTHVVWFSRQSEMVLCTRLRSGWLDSTDSLMAIYNVF